MTAWLPFCRTRANPCWERISQTSRPDTTRSLTNGDFDLGDEDLAAHSSRDLRGVCSLEEELEGFLEVRARLLHGAPLTRDVDLGAECDVAVALLLDDRGEELRRRHASHFPRSYFTPCRREFSSH